MITQNNLFHKEFGKVAVLLALSIPMVAFSAEKTLAIPLKPVFDQLGRRVMEGLLGVGSNAQLLPVNQQFTNTQPTVGDPGAYQVPGYSPPVDSTTPPAAYQAPAYQAPAYQAPAYQTPAYQAPAYQTPGYPPAYQAPAYQTPGYPPAYQAPAYQAPGYPPAYQAPAYQAPYPPAYPVYPPTRSSPPVIINNF